MEVKLGSGRFTVLNGAGLAPVTRGAGHQPGAGGYARVGGGTAVPGEGWLHTHGIEANDG